MGKIHIIGNQRNCYTRHLYPLFAFRKDLLDHGFKIKFFPAPDRPGVDQCDYLIFMADGHQDILPVVDKKNASTLAYLQDFFSRFQHVTWFDDNDSSGMLQPDIFPLVNIYAKSQLLKDTRYYLEEHLCGAKHRDYVHETFGIPDRNCFAGSISEQYLSKLRPAWNLSLINWNYYNAFFKPLKLYYRMTANGFKIHFTPPKLSSRQKIVTFRGRMWQKDPTIGWWRTKTIEHIENFNVRKFGPGAFQQGTVNRRTYQQEMTTALVSPSPFGKGEICYRDFECFMSGSLLFKPDMSHLTTFPNLFVDGETYISHRWDFEDFEAKLDQILTHPDRYEAIAREGQERFRNMLADKESFIQHFIGLILSPR